MSKKHTEHSDQSMKAQSVALAVVALLAGILIGVVGAHSFNITDEAVTEVVRQENPSDTPAARLRATLNTRMVEHIYLAETAAVASYQNDPSAEQRATALHDNAGQLAAELSVLENVTREDLERIGNQHADALHGYAAAARQQDQDAMRQHQQQLDTLTGELAGAIAPDLAMTEQDLKQSLDTHVQHMQRILSARAAGNYEEARKEQGRAREHMYQLSNELAADIVSTYPDRFE